MKPVDVAVVGGGPAGAAASLLFARAGLDVVLLERSRFPRAKPCGDCLSPNAARLLDRLGVLSEVEALGPARLAGWRVFAPGGHVFEGRFDRVATDRLVASAIAIPRSRFDSVLLGAAQRAGVDVRTGVRVTGLATESGTLTAAGVEGSPITIRARLVVGADGLRSVVARRIGAIARPAKLRKVSLTAHVTGLHADTDWGEMHTGRGLCVGLAPVTAGPHVLFNVTVVADADRHGRELARDPIRFFHMALARFPALRGRTHVWRFAPGEDGTGRVPQLLASGPFDAPTRRVNVPGVALVGDAAGYFDPFTGQGINQALADAFLLAREAVPPLLTSPHAMPSMARYQRRQRSMVRGARLVQRIIESVMSRPALADHVVGRLACHARAADTLLAVTGDFEPARSVLSPAVVFAVAGRSIRKGVAQ